MTADISAFWKDWSTSEGGNQPDDGIDLVVNTPHNLRRVQAVVKKALAFRGADIATAASINLDQDGAIHYLTGSVTVSALGTVSAGVRKLLYATSSFILTYNATSLIIPGGKTITLHTETMLEVLSLGSGNWQVIDIFFPKLTNVAGTTISAGNQALANLFQVRQFITLSPESGSSDDLDSIDVANLLSEGSVVTVRPAANMAITLKHTAAAPAFGKLRLASEFDYKMQRTTDNVTFVKVGNDWNEIHRALRVSRALLGKASNQNIPTSSVTTITWAAGSSVIENFTFTDGSDSLTALYDGWYDATLAVSFEAFTTVHVRVRLLLQVNAVTVRQFNTANSIIDTEIYYANFPAVQLSKDDIITFAVAHEDTPSKNIIFSNANTIATIALI